MSAYRFHPEAETDLEEIWEYIAVDNIHAADRVIAEIERAVQNVIKFPHSGHRRSDLTGRPLRFIRVRDYLVAYAPDEMPIWIIAVIHGHRDPRTMAAILRGRERHEHSGKGH